ncbi:hypothetical protein [uncultured Tateyamaria sp.]|uniref:DUF7742 family protein n=1 Tax=uncultured Tateyamaria sp. TaxID=455651 RepID=UPI00261A194D|nr:hypothetical protein [uncultured Tateyamaria sp.]
MRPVLAVDLLCAGRAVLQVPVAQRDDCAQGLLTAARIADEFRAQMAGMHPEFGDGTLASAARHAGMAREPAICEGAFAGALISVLQAIRDTHSISR